MGKVVFDFSSLGFSSPNWIEPDGNLVVSLEWGVALWWAGSPFEHEPCCTSQPMHSHSHPLPTNQPTYTHLRRVPSLCKCALPFSSLGTHPLPPLTSSSFPPLRFPLSSGLSSMHHLLTSTFITKLNIIMVIKIAIATLALSLFFQNHPKISHSQAEYIWYKLVKDWQTLVIYVAILFPAKFTLLPKTKVFPRLCSVYMWWVWWAEHLRINM